MDRNLDRRVEAVVPVEDHDARARLADIVEVMLADNRRSWQLGQDALWRRTEELDGEPGTRDTHATLKERALASGIVAAAPRRPGIGVGSLDPRA
jgi:polyphosphate kinase